VLRPHVSAQGIAAEIPRTALVQIPRSVGFRLEPGITEVQELLAPLYLLFEERSGSAAWRSTVTDGGISGIGADSPVGR
jgi:hypothetical protein